MSDDKNTQSQEDTKDVKADEQTEETTVQDEEEVTLGEVLEQENEAEKPKPSVKPKTVPIELFLELKKELKEAKSKPSYGSTSDSSIEDIAKEYNVDPDFVTKLASAIKVNTTKEFEEKYSGKISELEKISQKDLRDKKFNELFKKTIANYPDLKGVVNKDVIKQLALNPENGKKTLPQLLEEVYGSTVQGKKTMETSRPNSGEKAEGVDFTQAGDPAVYAKIKSDPKLFAEYRKFVQDNLNI
jgi:hypothetical protein